MQANIPTRFPNSILVSISHFSRFQFFAHFPGNSRSWFSLEQTLAKLGGQAEGKGPIKGASICASLKGQCYIDKTFSGWGAAPLVPPWLRHYILVSVTFVQNMASPQTCNSVSLYFMKTHSLILAGSALHQIHMIGARITS